MSYRKVPARKPLSAQHTALVLVLCVWLAAMQWVGGLHSASVRIAAWKPASVSAGISAATHVSASSLHDQWFASLESHGRKSASQLENQHPSDSQSCAFLDAHLNGDTCTYSAVNISPQDIQPNAALAQLPQRISRFLALGKQARAPPVA